MYKNKKGEEEILGKKKKDKKKNPTINDTPLLFNSAMIIFHKNSDCSLIVLRIKKKKGSTKTLKGLKRGRNRSNVWGYFVLLRFVISKKLLSESSIATSFVL